MVIVDDGSTDGTRDILNTLQHQPDIKVILHQQNLGKGGLSGQVSRQQLVIFVSFRMQIWSMIRAIMSIVTAHPREQDAGCIWLSLSGWPSKAMFFWHMVGNRMLTLVTNVLYNTILTDMETCYKVFTREVADKLHLVARGWGFDPEITAQILLCGYRIYEVPISYTGREFNEGKENIVEGWFYRSGDID